MRQLEIIRLRMTWKAPTRVVEEIRRSLPDVASDHSVRIYHAVGDADVAVHVALRVANLNTPGLSDLGVRLAAALREHGMVEHSLWLETSSVESKGGSL